MTELDPFTILISFQVERPSSHEMILSFDSWVILTCKKIIVNQQTILDNSFSLLPALDEGYFSDLELHAANGHTVSFLLSPAPNSNRY